MVSSTLTPPLRLQITDSSFHCRHQLRSIEKTSVFWLKELRTCACLMEVMACNPALTHTHTYARAHAQMLGENRVLRNTVQHKYYVIKTVSYVMELLYISASYTHTHTHKQTNKQKRISVTHAIDYCVMDDIRPHDQFVLY